MSRTEIPRQFVAAGKRALESRYEMPGPWLAYSLAFSSTTRSVRRPIKAAHGCSVENDIKAFGVVVRPHFAKVKPAAVFAFAFQKIGPVRRRAFSAVAFMEMPRVFWLTDRKPEHS